MVAFTNPVPETAVVLVIALSERTWMLEEYNQGCVGVNRTYTVVFDMVPLLLGLIKTESA